jgi:hypothetical protein
MGSNCLIRNDLMHVIAGRRYATGQQVLPAVEFDDHARVGAQQVAQRNPEGTLQKP